MDLRMSRVSRGDGVADELDDFRVRGAEHDDEIAGRVILRRPQQAGLIVQIKRARRRSDEALGHDHDHVRARRA
jgi:hypothetical protein